MSEQPSLNPSRLHLLAAAPEYVEDMRARHRRDPASVPEDWRAAIALIDAYFAHQVGDTSGDPDQDALQFARRFGHLLANLDPLDLPSPPRWAALRAEAASSAPNSIAGGAYSGTLTVETGHIDSVEQARWIQGRFESLDAPAPDARKRALGRLIRATVFEDFMSKRHPGKKRFGIEGSETLHVLIGRILDTAAAEGVEEVLIGGMHRGRLGLMAALLGQSPAQLFARMAGGRPLLDETKAGDVPYHMGMTAMFDTPSGAIRIHMLPNPSHLEAIDPVVLGFARGRRKGGPGASKILPLILHTDASVVAQGVVGECLQLTGVEGHDVGGAIHVVVNNQIGFTTDPHEGRASRYCTGPFKAVDSLICHVNGADADRVILAADLAVFHRQRFESESVVDLVCVRANGHNELDEPRFTQPVYYRKAAGLVPSRVAYQETLVSEGIVSLEDAREIEGRFSNSLEAAFEAPGPSAEDCPDPGTSAPLPQADTLSILRLVAAAPQAETNPKAADQVTRRLGEWDPGIPWATAEAMALGAILSTGRGVRLTGQDVERGAFSQRHFALIDQTGARHRMFETRPPHWGEIEILNTPLSEYAALGYAYGHSLGAPECLTIWEAQFGDFANGAQILFDQFIAAGDEKWGQKSNLVVLLPHGLEGQGPEHSSARIERFLQLAAKDNITLAHPSTPANYYHLLRAQAETAPRRPLIVFTPKKLLRLKAATSGSADFSGDRRFQPVLVSGDVHRAEHFILCSGKISYELLDAIKTDEISNTCVIRLEQLYPFPDEAVLALIESSRSADVTWLQEEPSNFGPACWIQARLSQLMSRNDAARRLRIVARPENPSPAGGFHADHDADQGRLLQAAIRRETVALT